ncbi:MAG: DUF2282 domain-containing protein [Rhizobiales bacterium]|nr:DUF2282 domain-containing protein [Hyphomicrobiales bacterium]
MTPSRRRTLQALATAIAAAVAPVAAQEMGENAEAVPKPAAAMERCFGVALAGQSDCSSSEVSSCAGKSVKDFDPLAHKLVPQGTCTSIETPFGHGSLTPINVAREEAM